MPSLPSRLRSVDRRWWLVAVVAVLLGGGAWLRFAPTSATTTQTITATIARGTYKSTVAATGTITPQRSADLAFTSAGTVTEVAVKAGDKVIRGDVLAKIDATGLRAQRDAAAAQLSAANAQLSGDSGGTTTQLAADRAAVASAASQLTQADEAVANATLTAPFSGTVSAVSYSTGDTTGASGGNSPAATSSSSSSTGITVISPRHLLVDANVSAADVSSVKVGMQAEITPTGGADVVYGTVSSVGAIASASDTGAAQFPVVVAVTGTPTGLYPGSSATVAITIKQATDVLTVPTQALHTTSTGSPYVNVMHGGTATKTTVTLGTAYGPQTEVLSGLKVGDVVELLSFTRPKGTGTTGTNGLFGRGTGSGGGNFPSFPGGGGPGGGQAPVIVGGQ